MRPPQALPLAPASLLPTDAERSKMKVSISDAHVRVYRAVHGAVVNTAHGHPKWTLTREMARSIAKRATGTLTAEWPDVLAARQVPSEANDPSYGGCWPPRRVTTARRAGERRVTPRRSPSRLAWKELSILCGEAKRAGQVERAEALVEAPRIIARYETSK